MCNGDGWLWRRGSRLPLLGPAVSCLSSQGWPSVSSKPTLQRVDASHLRDLESASRARWADDMLTRGTLIALYFCHVCVSLGERAGRTHIAHTQRSRTDRSDKESLSVSKQRWLIWWSHQPRYSVPRPGSKSASLSHFLSFLWLSNNAAISSKLALYGAA